MRPDLNVLGTRIREARLRLGLTQAQLGERVDCSPEWISKIERGRASPSLVTVTRIGSELGADMTLLLESNHDNLEGNGVPEHGASLLRALDHENQETAICLLEALLRMQKKKDGH